MPPVSIAALAGGALCLALAIRSHLGKQTLETSLDDACERLTTSERTVADLQARRADNERTIEQQKIAIREIEEQRKQTHEMLSALRQQVERVARIDGHTGIANHQHFVETLGEEIKRSVRQRKPLSLLVGELDFFDNYMDLNGQERGDYALQAVASSVSDTFRRAGDLVARIGNARFAVILPEADDRTGQRFAEKLRRSVYDLCIPFPGSDAADRMTMSVGMVTVPPKRLHDRSAVIEMAEHALNHAQSNGFNQVAQSAHAA
ncbi:MAG: GGDEF domain-containing protein [Gammaproteobacteria bacterium]